VFTASWITGPELTLLTASAEITIRIFVTSARTITSTNIVNISLYITSDIIIRVQVNTFGPLILISSEFLFVFVEYSVDLENE
jgi:hypothetical protein